MSDNKIKEILSLHPFFKKMNGYPPYINKLSSLLRDKVTLINLYSYIESEALSYTFGNKENPFNIFFI